MMNERTEFLLVFPQRLLLSATFLTDMTQIVEDISTSLQHYCYVTALLQLRGKIAAAACVYLYSQN